MAISSQNAILNQYVPPFCVTTPVNGEALLYDNATLTWKNRQLTADDLGGVAPEGLVWQNTFGPGDVVTISNDLTAFVSVARSEIGGPGGGATSLNDLTDVGIIDPKLDNQVLTYDTTVGVWTNEFVDYTNLTNIPTEFPPSSHDHVEANITDLDKYTQSEVDALLTSKTNLVTGTIGNFTSLASLGQLLDSGSSSSDFASAAQGVLADSALQSSDNVSLLLNDAGYLTSIINQPFTELTDTPANYIGSSGQVVSIKIDETGLEFKDANAHTHLEASITDLDKYSQGQVDTLLTSKTDLVTGITGMFASLGIGGQLLDSGSNSSDFATSAQGSLADSALQSGDNVSSLNNDAGYLIDITNQPFTELTDTPLNYTGASGQVVSVKVDETGLEFTDVSSGLIQSITAGTGMTDTGTATDSILNVGAGTGLLVSATQLSANFSSSGGSNGVASTIARSDHNHTLGSLSDVILTGIATDDIIKWNGSAFVNTPAQASQVNSVFGRTGAVTALEADYTSFYATTAQGVLADTSTQPGDNVSTLTNDTLVPLTGAIMTGDLDFSESNLTFQDSIASKVAGLGLTTIYSVDANDECVLVADDFDGSGTDPLGVRVKGAYFVIDSPALAVGVPGFEVGSRLVASGTNTDGQAIIGWEPRPTPSYEVQANNSTDIFIGTGSAPTAWVAINNDLTLTQDVANNEGTFYYSVKLDNTTVRTGSVDIGVGFNGANPTSAQANNAMTSGQKSVFAGVIRNTVAFSNTDTLTLFARIASNNNNQFSVTTRGSESTTNLTFGIAGEGGGGAGEINTASNLGAAEGLFAQKNGVDLEFKSIKAGTNVTLSSDSNELTINSTGGGGGSTFESIRVNYNFAGSISGVQDASGGITSATIDGAQYINFEFSYNQPPSSIIYYGYKDLSPNGFGYKMTMPASASLINEVFTGGSAGSPAELLTNMTTGKIRLQARNNETFADNNEHAFIFFLF